MKRWTKEEEILLADYINNKVTFKEIAVQLNRTIRAIGNKASKLNLKSKVEQISKTNEEYIKEVASIHKNNVIPVDSYINNRTRILHKCDKNHEWYATPNNILSKRSGCPKCYEHIKFTTSEYKNKLPNNIIVLEEYLGTDIHIMHKNIICNHTWKARPHDILGKFTDCPECNKGFNKYNPAYVYCIYFKDLDLYKVGITKSIKKRMTEFGYKPEIIFSRYFKTGLEAINLENEFLKNVNELLYNTGKLTSGNTETFKIKDTWLCQ